jgi:hypothetical protein
LREINPAMMAQQQQPPPEPQSPSEDEEATGHKRKRRHWVMSMAFVCFLLLPASMAYRNFQKDEGAADPRPQSACTVWAYVHHVFKDATDHNVDLRSFSSTWIIIELDAYGQSAL